ncbi:MAG TPA: AraC family transcriptional regulator [Candidatus Acidoferrales bacterium]|nr:AraC family transcriptional regulator [Candidatus Acidoferrales bacterium]
MNADTKILYNSKFYSITDFHCKSKAGENSGVEYQTDFSLSFTRRGNFIYNVFRNSLDAHSGRILLNKPDHEHTVSHMYHVPDECTCFAFRPQFYESVKERHRRLVNRFFTNNDVHSILIKSDAALDFLHNKVLRLLKDKRCSGLLIDSIVYEIVNLTLAKLAGEELVKGIPASLKKYHLQTVERAKEYINENYARDLSLDEIAENSYVSPFHFSRIFKTFTSYSPHRYLVDTRLKNAENLIKNSDRSITDICFSSGFESLEHFSASFKNKYRISPSQFRAKNS